MFALWQNLSLSVVQVAERNDGRGGFAGLPQTCCSALA